MPGEREGIDDLTRWLGLRWEAHDRVRLTIRPELINPAGLLAGPVAYAMVDYSMGSALWQQRSKGERIATIGISINYVQTAREGDVICESVVDRATTGWHPPERVRHEDGRPLATAIGSRVFPARGWVGTSAARRRQPDSRRAAAGGPGPDSSCAASDSGAPVLAAKASRSRRPAASPGPRPPLAGIPGRRTGSCGRAGRSLHRTAEYLPQDVAETAA